MVAALVEGRKGCRGLVPVMHIGMDLERHNVLVRQVRHQSVGMARQEDSSTSFVHMEGETSLHHKDLLVVQGMLDHRSDRAPRGDPRLIQEGQERAVYGRAWLVVGEKGPLLYGAVLRKLSEQLYMRLESDVDFVWEVWRRSLMVRFRQKSQSPNYHLTHRSIVRLHLRLLGEREHLCPMSPLYRCRSLTDIEKCLLAIG
jgi:hypothetical protein